jgi:hypothetical protein
MKNLPYYPVHQHFYEEPNYPIFYLRCDPWLMSGLIRGMKYKLLRTFLTPVILPSSNMSTCDSMLR